MKRQAAAAKAAKSDVVCTDAQLLKRFPTVVQYLTDSVWDDGKPREVSTLTVFIEGGLVKLALNDRAELRSLYVTSDSLNDALSALETVLASAGGDWRAWKSKKGR